MSEPLATIPSDPSIVPTLLKDLEFGDTEKKHDALAKLTTLSQEDPSFTSDHISPQAAELFRILKLPETQADLDHRISLVRFISSLFYLTAASRAIFAPHVDAIVPYLIPCYTIECLHVQYALSRLTEADPSSHSTIIASLKSHLYNTHPTHNTTTTPTPEIDLGAVEVYGYTIQNSYAECAKLFFKAGAYDATIAALQAPQDAQTRLAALICLRQVYPLAQTTSETSSSYSETFSPVAITRAVIQCLGDESVEVAFEAMSFLESMSTEDEMRGELLKDPGALRVLVFALARDKPAGSGATGPHWLLARVGEGTGGAALVKGAFEGVWKDGEVSVEVKLQIVRGMLGKYVDVRKAAIEAGLCDLLLEEVIQNGGEERSAILVVLEKLVGEAQSAGYYLMQKGCIEPLLDIVEGPSPTDRPLALSIFARLLESYGPSPSPGSDPVAQRPTVAAALTSPTVLPRIMASFHSPTPDGAAHLLAEILLGEPGTKAWDYTPSSSSSPPPSTPYKDLLVTPSLIAHTLALLRTHTAPKDSLRLLYQCVWGYARGFDLVQAAMEHIIADVDVFFLAALCGTHDGLEALTQGRRVAEAAYLAGALPRAFEVLAREEASDAAHRRAAVEGLRFVLGAPSANKDLARQNEVLPRVLAALVADETRASIEAVVWMLRLLENGQDNSWLIGWSDFGNEKTVGHLVGLLQQVSYNFDPDGKKAPDSRVLDKTAFDKAAEAYWNNVNESRKLCEKLTELVVECINKTLPIIAPHSLPLIEPLVIRCHELGGNSAILETLNKLLASSNRTNEPLVSAFKHLLSLPTPPPIHRFGDWVRAGPAFAAGLGEAGLASWLLTIVTLENELDERYIYRRQALTTLAELVENTTDPTRARDLRKLFFDTDKAVKVGIELATTSPDNSYYAPEVKGALGTLVKDYPEGAVRLESEGLSLSIDTPRDREVHDSPAAFHHERPVKLKKKRSRWCFWM